jgi:hypothetical protein
MLDRTQAPVDTDDFSADELEIFATARAVSTGLRRRWESWVDLGRAIQVIDRHVSVGDGGTKTKGLRFYAIARAHGLDWLSANRRTVGYLRELMGRLPEIERWRNGLSDAQRILWASPHSVHVRRGLFNSGKESGEPVIKPRPMTLAEFLRLPADEAATLLLRRCPAKAYALKRSLTVQTGVR